MTQAAADPVTASTWYRTLLGTVAGMITDALTPLLQPRTFTLWYSLDAGSTALATTDYIEGPVDFPFLITGWTLLSRTSGSIVLSLRRAAYTDYPVFTSICSSSPPQLSATTKAKDATLAGWTTLIAGDDILTIGVVSNTSALTRVSLGLRARALGPTMR